MKKKIISLIFFLSIFTNVFASKDDFLKIGPADAKVVVKVFSSLTCPHCAAFHKEIFDCGPQIDYDHKFKNLPYYASNIWPKDMPLLKKTAISFL